MESKGREGERGWARQEPGLEPGYLSLRQLIVRVSQTQQRYAVAASDRGKLAGIGSPYGVRHDRPDSVYLGALAADGSGVSVGARQRRSPARRRQAAAAFPRALSLHGRPT